MNLSRTIQELYTEKMRIDEVIRSLEQFVAENGTPTTRRRRGRKSMNADERNVVSQRMRNYWASRREDRTQQAMASD